MCDRQQDSLVMRAWSKELGLGKCRCSEDRFKRRYFGWILKDLFTHSKSIVEYLLYVRFYERCRVDSGEKRPRFTLRVDTEMLRGLWAARSPELGKRRLSWQWSGLTRGGVGLRCQPREKPSSATSPVGTGCLEGALIQSPAWGQLRRAAHPLTMAWRTRKVSPVPRST